MCRKTVNVFQAPTQEKQDKLNSLNLLNSLNVSYTEELHEKKKSFTEKKNSVKLFFNSFFLCETKTKHRISAILRNFTGFRGQQNIRANQKQSVSPCLGGRRDPCSIL
jgi:hypothetical protein